MKHILATSLILLFAIVSLSFSAEVATVDDEIHNIPSFVGYVSNRIVVNFDPAIVRMMETRAFRRGRTGIPAFDQLGERLGANFIRAQFPGAQKKSYKGRVIDLSGWHKIEFAGKVDVKAVVEAFKRIPGVIDAQPISMHTVYKEPTEQFYDWQWHLPKIQAPQAWDIETGNPDIIVAVLDTGVRYFQKDLGGVKASYSSPNDVNGNMWINWTEKNGTPGFDDDGNGYVDDWIGWDFVERTQDSFLIYCYPSDFLELGEEGEDCGTADNDPRDFNGHGTHCAGIASAMNHNSEAVASIAGGWGDGRTVGEIGNGVKIMPLRIGWSAVYLGLLEVGLVTMDYAAEALYYAAKNGARIASCSWGSANDGGIAAAIDEFLASGGLIFKAAGNDSSETQDYMCEREDIIKVAATDPDDCIAYFSNYGDWVDVSAPGVEIWSLYHYHYDPEQDYVTAMDGTSMAAPLAAGVAALIWSRDPDLKAEQVKQMLYESADPLDSLPCNVPYAGKLGAGRINAYTALNTELPTLPDENLLNVKEFLVGKYEISGRGKNKTTTFIEQDSFKAGDAVILRVLIIDESSGLPVADAAADIAITGPEIIYVSTGYSKTDGIADGRWKTSKPRGKSRTAGTSPGTYTATVTHVMADNCTWNGESLDVTFSVQ